MDVIAEDASWGVADLPGICRRAGAAVARHLVLPVGCEAVVLGGSDARIAELNGQFRARHQATNVLSWPQHSLAADAAGDVPRVPASDPMEDGIALGDIALAFETCRIEARAAGIPFEAHITHLVVHGLLHLLGYDHIRDKDADLMEAREVEILALLDVPNPYG
ncbi:rRNA maturation RNase YbeY [Actibacterium sp. 188UL27-1]|uniref:rRNA maturation RNase YbeY n=1 Tax=Actibacterium sp. 188UL27-1 TaxID=2786961 RepID=UPI00351C4383